MQVTEPTLRGSLQARDDIRAFIGASGELPSPRGVALELMRLTREPETDMRQIARRVMADPALTAFVIRAANSARFIGSPKVIDVPRAVARLGLNMVRVYAIAVSLMQGYRTGRCPGFDYEAYWMRALFAAIAMGEMAPRGAFLQSEEAFALGLLSRVGELCFATAAPQDYAGLLAASGDDEEELARRERDGFGFDHNELTAVLLVEWGIPARLADVVFWQQDPEAGGYGCNAPEHRLASQLQLAVTLARVCLAAPGEADARVPALFLRAEIAAMGADELVELSAIVCNEWVVWAADMGLRGARPYPLIAA